MKVLVLAPKSRYVTYGPETPTSKAAQLIFCDREGTEAEWLAAGGDADALFVTPVTAISAAFIAQMPHLSSPLGRGLTDLIWSHALRPGASMCATTPGAMRRQCPN